MDDFGLIPESAAWIHVHDLGEWRYIVATAAIDAVGPRKLYGSILDLFETFKFDDDLTADDVQLVSLEEPWHDLLRECAQEEANAPVVVKNRVVNGVKVDVLIYRFLPAPGFKLLGQRAENFAEAARAEAELRDHDLAMPMR